MKVNGNILLATYYSPDRESIKRQQDLGLNDDTLTYQSGRACFDLYEIESIFEVILKTEDTVIPCVQLIGATGLMTTVGGRFEEVYEAWSRVKGMSEESIATLRGEM
jgi:hypothetical protein